MSTPLFVYESRQSPRTGHMVGCVGIKCGKCGKKAFHAAPDISWGRKIFRKKDWSIGLTTKGHRCPDCVELRTNGIVVATTDSVVPERRLPDPVEMKKGLEPEKPKNSILAEKLAEAMANAAPKAEQPKPATVEAKKAPKIELSLSDKRLIREELSRLYDEPAQSYRPGWSDMALAAALGMSVEAVAQVRSDYGPDSATPEPPKPAALVVDPEVITELKDLVSQAVIAADTAIEAGAQLETLMAKINAMTQEAGLA